MSLGGWLAVFESLGLLSLFSALPGSCLRRLAGPHESPARGPANGTTDF